MNTIASQTTFQPRLLKDPHDPVNSEWELAVFEPDVDDQSFAMPNEAMEAGLSYIAEKWNPRGSGERDTNSLGLRADLRRLRLVAVTTICMPLPVTWESAIHQIREKIG